MTTRSIGRHSDCDIVLTDPTVSRRHAELSEIGADLFMVVDQDSTSGSFRWDGGAWKRFHSARLRMGDRIRLGACETTVGDLLARAGGRSPEAAAFTAPPQSAPLPVAAPRKVERDPLTGQIVVRPR